MSNMRIGGLASGMDIDSIVKDMMRIEQLKVDKTFQNKTLLEWTRSAYNDVNKKLAEFVLGTKKSFGLTQTSGGSVINKSVNSLDWIKGVKIENDKIADIKGRSNAVNGTYNINVKSLATNWSAASSENISKGDKSNLKSQFDLKDQENFAFTIDTGQGKVDIKIEDIKSTSLKDIVKQINAADIGVTATYDESIDRFFLQTNNTGKNSTLKIIETEGNFISKLKLQHEVMEKGEGEEVRLIMKDVALDTTYAGTDAIIDFGAAKGIQKSSNQFTINGIDFDLKAPGATTIKVETDENAVVDKIQDFVDQYNKLVDDIGKTLTENRHRGFPPLTNEQKEAMNDKEVELWEEKAKSGLLRNDEILSRTMQTIRSGLYENVQGTMGKFKHLTDIGIDTEGYSAGSTGGRLILNTDKLRTALREDTEGVVELLFKEPDEGETSESAKRNSTGLVGRMYNDMVVGMKNIIAKAGPGEDSQLYRNVNSRMLIDFVTQHSSISMIDKNITSYEKRIAEMERRMIEKENSYWAKFTAMEKALSNMYSQSSWLAQQLGI